MSLVMDAWRQYTGTLRESDHRARSTPRRPGAVGIYLSAATGCPRRESFRLLKYPAERTSADKQAIFDIGIRSEEKIALVLAGAGWKIERQYPLQTGWGNGRIDILAYPPGLDRELIIEIKSTKLDQLKWLPRKEHVQQCLLYMGEWAQTHPMPLGEVVYVLRAENGGTEKVTAYPVEWNADEFKRLMDKLNLIEQYVKDGEPVPIEMCGDVKSDKPPCKYSENNRCQYWLHCWGNGQRYPQQELFDV